MVGTRKPVFPTLVVKRAMHALCTRLLTALSVLLTTTSWGVALGRD